MKSYTWREVILPATEGCVPAGMRKVMFASGDTPLIMPIEPGHEQSLIEFERHQRDTFEN